MAGKKGSKTSKTDHVLNLISGMTQNQEATAPPPEKTNRSAPSEKTPAAAAQAPAAGAAPSEEKGTAAQPAPAPYRAAPILEVARTNHEALSETVHQALENALAEELREEEEQHEEELREEGPQTGEEQHKEEEQTGEDPHREEERHSEPENTPEQEAAPPPQEPAQPAGKPQDTPVPVPEAAPAPTAPKPEPPSAPRPEASPEKKDGASAPPKPSRQVETDIVNVMQILVSENLDRYVNMFQLCRCSRCLADVQALALTNLPAKYVVMDHGKLSSMLGYYRHRYATPVMIELTKACNVVKQNPHHDG